MSALDDVAAERIRQIEEKGYDAEHDDAEGQTLAAKASRYASPSVDDVSRVRRLDLVKAGALVVAEIDRMDRARAGVPQAYLPKAVCYAGRSIQCAIEIRAELLAFLKRHPHLRVFSGLRIGDAGDHRCGYATDLVPLDYADKADVVNAFTDATLMMHRDVVAYVEPLIETWIPGNHHLHVSWKRCP